MEQELMEGENNNNNHNDNNNLPGIVPGEEEETGTGDAAEAERQRQQQAEEAALALAAEEGRRVWHRILIVLLLLLNLCLYAIAHNLELALIEKQKLVVGGRIATAADTLQNKQNHPYRSTLVEFVARFFLTAEHSLAFLEKDNEQKKKDTNADEDDETDEETDMELFSSSIMDEESHKTTKPMTVVSHRDFHTHRSQPHSHEASGAAESYWKRAASNVLAHWDATLEPSKDIVGGLLLSGTTTGAATASSGGSGRAGKAAAYLEGSSGADLSTIAQSAASIVTIPPTSTLPAATTAAEMYRKSPMILGWLALKRAAQKGHPHAQYVVANAMAAGFWPFDKQPDHSKLQQQKEQQNKSHTDEDEEKDSSSKYSRSSSSSSSSAHVDFLTRHDRKLKVQDTFIDPHDSQQSQAIILWHMAALGGHVEAAMTMAHRMEEKRKYISSSSSTGGSSGSAAGGAAAAHAAGGATAAVEAAGFVTVSLSTSASATSTSTTTTTKPNKNSASFKSSIGKGNSPPDFCEQVLPYYEAAAHGILDQLEADPQSRAKVLPPKEGHMLHQVHLHGGTGSQLEWHNKPDESASALQFYHVRAIDPSTGQAASPHAAFTLAHLYHYGLRGVTQNLTLAAKYYGLAAKAGHWEAAGQAGDFYLWGIGVEQDPYEAHKFYRLGMPFGLQGCRQKYEMKLRMPKAAQQEAPEVFVCDSAALNGMGLLTLLGLPMIVQVDTESAEQLFQLAKEQGSKDAPYNLAMMKLGYKTHFRSMDDMESQGTTKLMPNLGKTVGGEWSSSPTHQELQSILTDLTTAAGKGHVQAKHRLAMMYTTGVTAPHKGTPIQVIPKDCEKAVKNFRWIIENASPQRSRRLRKAYKQYVAGDWSASLRNYLAAAEAGSELAQVNAAFLLEQGVCLGMHRIDCSKASVRLWKAAATRGHSEASLRVGDFYYYGRLRNDNRQGVVGPFGWIHYILYPEELLSRIVYEVRQKYLSLVESKAALEGQGGSEKKPKVALPEEEESDEPVCRAEKGKEEVCSAKATPEVDEEKGTEGEEDEEEEHTLQKDLKMASHYYRMAAERANPRANFNLGFLYEWGLGLKQDFHLAKRHYDLAVTGPSKEAEFAVSIALIAMNAHQTVVKWWFAIQDWLNNAGASQDGESEKETTTTTAGLSEGESDSVNTDENLIPSLKKADPSEVGRPVPSPTRAKKRTKMDVILSHLWSWESLLILVLTIILTILLRQRRTRR